jgi:hypothetical protein
MHDNAHMATTLYEGAAWYRVRHCVASLLLYEQHKRFNRTPTQGGLIGGDWEWMEEHIGEEDEYDIQVPRE